MFNFNQLEINHSDQLCLTISSVDQQVAWQESQNQSNAIARYNAYLNRLCLKTVLKWLSEGLTDPSSPKLSVLFNPDSLSSIWEVVNGIILQSGEAKLTLIPSDDPDLDVFCVPQEWVDIPDWIADYYLAIHVNLEGDEEDSWIQVLGFTTHRQLKNNGQYHECDRTYTLPRAALIEDLSVMELTMGLHVQTEVAPLPTLAAGHLTKLLQILGNPSLYSPRLRTDIPFTEWAALIVDENLRQKLYEQRIHPAVPVYSQEKSFNLKEWLHNKVEAGQNAVEEVWQNFELLFAQTEVVRSRNHPQRNSSPAIEPIINLLKPDKPNEIRYQAAGVLGEIGVGNPKVINALTELLHTSTDEETRWQASLSLGKVDPNNPLAGCRKARLIDLGMRFADYKIGLIVAIMPKTEGRIEVLLKVQPLQHSTRLPVDLTMTILSEFGEAIPRLETKARSDDQGQDQDRDLKLQFSPPPGTAFQVKISWGELSITERFIA